MKLHILISLMLLLLISCSNAEEEYKIKITAYDGNFKGTYTIDGGSDVAYAGIEQSNSIYSYEFEEVIEDNIYIIVSPDPDTSTTETDDTKVSSIVCRIYKDKELVFDSNVSVSSTEPKIFTYDIGGTNTDTSK